MRIPYLIKKQNKILLAKAIQIIESIRKNNNVLVICSQPTGYSWLGVNIATKSLFPNNTFEIPQYYSNSIFTDRELVLLTNVINNLAFKQVVFSGFAPFYEMILNNLNEAVIVKVIYHGFLAELSENEVQQKVFNRLILLGEKGKIKAVGFVKKGLALSISKLYNILAFEIILPTNNSEIKLNNFDNNEIKIGCLVNSSFRKNIHNQVVAGLMVQNSKIYTFKTDELNYLPQDRIITHSLMNHKEFVSLLGSMSVNLHVTFSESWGQVLSESISQGVPCISANTSSFFDYNEELKQKLVVDGFDDSWFIYKKIENVLKERDYLSKKCIEYSNYLNSLSKERLDDFLNA